MVHMNILWMLHLVSTRSQKKGENQFLVLLESFLGAISFAKQNTSPFLLASAS